MTPAAELVKAVEAIGGTFHLDGNDLRLRYPAGARDKLATLIPELRTLKEDVVRVIRERRDDTNAPRRCPSPAQTNNREDWFDDPYGRSASEALHRLGELGWVLGIRTWLEKANPALHQEIYFHLPSQIDQAWGPKPIEEFQALLNRWVGAHQRAVNEWKLANR